MLVFMQSYFFTLLESVLLYWMISSTLPCKFQGYKKLLYTIGAIILDSLFVQFCPVKSQIIKPLFIMFVSTTIVFLLYKESISKKIFLIFLNNFILLISDIISGNLWSILYKTNIERLVFSASHSTVYFSILSKFMVVVLVISFIRFINKINLDISSKYWVIMDCVIGFLIIIIQFFMEINHTLQQNMPGYSVQIFNISVCFLFMTIMIVYLFGEICQYYQKAQQRYTLDIQNRMLEQQLAYQEVAATDLKKFRHDVNSNLANISYLLRENHIEESVNYINAIASSLESIKTINCGNKYIDAILNYEISLCKKNQINTQLNIDTIPDLCISPMDLSSIISNIMNNSIEANRDIPQPERYLSLKIFCYKNYATIICKNPFIHRLIEIGGDLKTNKWDNLSHGYGLKLIKSSTEKYGGTFKYSYDNNIFTLIVMLPLNINSGAV